MTHFFTGLALALIAVVLLRLFARRDEDQGRLAEQLGVAERLNDELAEANARLIQIALTDGLTGLMNYRHFRETLDNLSSYTRRHEEPLSLMLVDVDRFKDFNDTYGHQEGDEALIAVAKTLRANARDYDLVARYGGEEFAVLLPGTDLETAVWVAERLRAAVEGRDWPLRPITVSIGIGTMDSGKQSVGDLLGEADTALYLAKGRGRNRVVHHRHLAEQPPAPRSLPDPDGLRALFRVRV